MIQLNKYQNGWVFNFVQTENMSLYFICCVLICWYFVLKAALHSGVAPASPVKLLKHTVSVSVSPCWTSSAALIPSPCPWGCPYVNATASEWGHNSLLLLWLFSVFSCAQLCWCVNAAETERLWIKAALLLLYFILFFIAYNTLLKIKPHNLFGFKPFKIFSVWVRFF